MFFVLIMMDFVLIMMDFEPQAVNKAARRERLNQLQVSRIF